MSQYQLPAIVYGESRTKQSFRDETDINVILKRANKSGTISHLNKYEGRYGDFANFDFFENTLMLTKGREIFDELPSEIRSEFHNSPSGFFKYVNDPANKDRLETLLPALAAPGRQNIDVTGKTAVAETTEPEAKVEKKAILDPRVVAETSLEDKTGAPKRTETVEETKKAG